VGGTELSVRQLRRVLNHRYTLTSNRRELSSSINPVFPSRCGGGDGDLGYPGSSSLVSVVWCEQVQNRFPISLSYGGRGPDPGVGIEVASGTGD